MTYSKWVAVLQNYKLLDFPCGSQQNMTYPGKCNMYIEKNTYSAIFR